MVPHEMTETSGCGTLAADDVVAPMDLNGFFLGVRKTSRNAELTDDATSESAPVRMELGDCGAEAVEPAPAPGKVKVVGAGGGHVTDKPDRAMTRIQSQL